MNFLRKIKTFLKIIIEVIKAQYEFKLEFCPKVRKLEIDKTISYEISDYKCTLMLGLPKEVPAIGLINVEGISILANNAFHQLDKKTKYSLASHEMGHIKFGHIDFSGTKKEIKRKKKKVMFGNILRIIGIEPVIEREADDYAFQKCGKDYIAALELLQKKYTEYFGISHGSLSRRIKRLQE